MYTDKNIYFETVHEKLRQDGFELFDDKICGLGVVIATKKEFRLSWFATQMNIFAIMSAVKNVSKDVIEDFSKCSIEYAIKHKGGLPRGLHTGVCSFALLVSSNIEEDAKQWVQKRPKRHFAAAEIPVLYDLKSNELFYYKKTPIWGAIYYGFFRTFIEKYFKQ